MFKTTNKLDSDEEYDLACSKCAKHIGYGYYPFHIDAYDYITCKECRVDNGRK